MYSILLFDLFTYSENNKKDKIIIIGTQMARLPYLT